MEGSCKTKEDPSTSSAGPPPLQMQGRRGSGAGESAMPLLAAMTDTRRFAVVILAAGQGTRMRSDTHKVLHPIASRALLLH